MWSSGVCVCVCVCVEDGSKYRVAENSLHSNGLRYPFVCT